MTDLRPEDLHIMPWSRHLMSEEQFEQWVASRKEAGRHIDPATCEIGCWVANAQRPSPYTVGKDYNDTYNFVRDAASGGWISETDLPRETYRALEDRIQREHAARAARP